MKFTFQPETRPLDGYTIKRAINRGGFGEVYYAVSDSGKEVALKLLQHNLDVELRGISQCLNLKHPNLLAIFDIRTDSDGDSWVVMEYMSGKSLDRILAEHPQGLPIERVKHWLAGAVEGLAFLHDRGIVHRDVKPANIFMDQGIVKIGDVGLSKFVSPSKRSAQTESVGTVYYMAPEVAHGRYGCEVDVYSTGIILYEMLTGQVPFDGESTAEILMKQLSQSPDLSVIPPALRSVIARALHKDPRMRTPSIRQLGEEFLLALRLAPSKAASAKTFDGSESIWLEDEPVRKGTRAAGTRPAGARTVDSRTRPGKPYRRAVRHPRPAWKGFDRRPWMLLMMAFGFAFFAFASPRVMGGGGKGFAMMIALVCGSYLVSKYFLGEGSSSTVAEPNVEPPRKPVTYAAGYKENGYREHRVRRRYSSPPNPLTRRSIGLAQRVAEASTSMSWAALFTVILSVFISVLAPVVGDPHQLWGDLGRTGLFLTTTLVAVWSLIGSCKLMEGTSLSTGLRRLVLLGIGVCVGASAWWLDDVLLVDLGYSHLADSSMMRTVGRQSLLTESWQPTLMGYMVFFGALFSLRRWYWHVDAFRPKRFRISSLLATGFLGMIIPAIFAFPQGWAVSWAAAISAVAQLSAVWIAPKQRLVELETTTDV